MMACEHTSFLRLLLQSSVVVSLLMIGECVRDSVIYTNQFAVYIPDGKDAADRVADKHNFINTGQIGSLEGYYLFEHNHVHKRSTTPSDNHHDVLKAESEVWWVQQQHEKRRVKRDFQEFTFPQFGTGAGLGTFQPILGHPQQPRPGLLDPAASARHFQRGTTLLNGFPDPLFDEQWYLDRGARDGHDMNVQPAWKKGYTGKSVVVSILDDGIQTNHPDLAQNYDPDASTDINNNDVDPMPRDNGDNKHGTRCAGEVAAVAYNGVCGVGIAYNASIGGVRMLDGTVNDAVEARALSLNPDHIDIYSASWGPEDDGKTVDGPGPLAKRAFIHGVMKGRKGKGSIFVWASGNGGRRADNCNCDGYTNSIFTLSISSATQGGYKPWYLEECSSTLTTTYSSGTPGHDKSVATVDMDGRLRPDHICTVQHTGTSASAPLAAGICALALEANPNLTWRDMQHLVVMTSNPKPLQREGGWITNGVKRKVSHMFGYGLMDAGALVDLAEQWVSVPPQHLCVTDADTHERLIPSEYGSSVEVFVEADGCPNMLNEVNYLEHVQCKISLRYFPRGNLRIVLTSPAGTSSTLLFERPQDILSSSFDDWPFLSVHFWGERPAGQWTLQIINQGTRTVNQPGILKKWQLMFYGTDINPVQLRSPFRKNKPVQQHTQPTSSIQNPIEPFPTLTAPPPQSSNSGDSYTGSAFSPTGFHRFPNIFSFAGSHPVTYMATLDETTKAPSEARSMCDIECSQGCLGKGPSRCKKCKNFSLRGTCVSECPPKMFPDSNHSCQPCHESCNTCLGLFQDNCLSCTSHHYKIQDLSLCAQQCPEGYYQNNEENVCIPCDANCASCNESPSHCTSCEHHLVLYNKKCNAVCPKNTYETQDYGCESCHSSCETCVGPSEKQCVTCPDESFYFHGACVHSCPSEHYGSKETKECHECPAGCGLCVNSNHCISCQQYWSLNSRGQCEAKNGKRCDAAKYFDGKNCQPCDQSCQTCSGSSSMDCLTCASDKVFLHSACVSACPHSNFVQNGSCMPCPHTCQQCESLNNCSQCNNGLYLENGSCLAVCSKRYYSDRGKCRHCYASCETCRGPRHNDCVTCHKDWVFTAGECHKQCPGGYFQDKNRCQKCHHTCRTCEGEGPFNCTSCPLNFMVDGGICMKCQSGQYYDHNTMLCRPCDPSCQTCTGADEYTCTSCRYPLHHDIFNLQCVPCCGSGVEQKCCHCDSDTGQCRGSASADKRRISLNTYHRKEGEKPSSLQNPFTLIGVAVMACICIVALFGIIFGVLQARSNRQLFGMEGYQKLPTSSRYERGIETVAITEVDFNDLCEENSSDDEDQVFLRT